MYRSSGISGARPVHVEITPSVIDQAEAIPQCNSHRNKSLSYAKTAYIVPFDLSMRRILFPNPPG